MTDFLGQLIARNTGASRSVRPRPLSLFEPPASAGKASEAPPVVDGLEQESTGDNIPLAMKAPPPRAPEDTAQAGGSPDSSPAASPAPHNFDRAVAMPSPDSRPTNPAFASFAETGADSPPLPVFVSLEPAPAGPPRVAKGNPGAAVSPSPPPPTRSPAAPAPDSLPRLSSRAWEHPHDTSEAGSDTRRALDLIERLVAGDGSRASASAATKQPEERPSGREGTERMAPQPASLPSMVRQMVLQTVAREVAASAARRPSPRSTAGTMPAAAPTGATAAAHEMLRPQAELLAPEPLERPAPPPRLTPRVERAPVFPPAPAPPSSAPSIRVTIGRVEIRATTDAAGSAPARPRPQPALMSLDAYLAQRGAGERR